MTRSRDAARTSHRRLCPSRQSVRFPRCWCTSVCPPLLALSGILGCIEVLLQEGPELLPAVHRLLVTVHRQVVVKETVPCPLVGVEFIRLVVLLQFLLVESHLGWRRVLVILAKQAK